jgi:sarcosine oxidase/L-pipecolate oxidase
MDTTPKHILILGSGVFGLSTAFALTKRPIFSNTKITVLDKSPFPAPDGSSIDTSRIVRPDYKDPAYAKLAALAQDEWRKQGDDELGGQGRYSENGLMLVANRGVQGEEYVTKSLDNARHLAKPGDEDSVVYLKDRTAIDKVARTGGGSGDWGYVNKRSGWADAEASMVWLHKQAEKTGKIDFVTGTAEAFLYDNEDQQKVIGVRLKDGSTINADLVIAATGAWTGKLIDLSGRAQATGQVLCYLEITDEEQERLKDIPTLLNMSEGMFIIPPRHNLLKVARHGYGYTNPISVARPAPSHATTNGVNGHHKIIGANGINGMNGVDLTNGTNGMYGYTNGHATVQVSVPRTKLDDPNLWVPQEGEDACRKALSEMIPFLADRPFSKSKICWYTDTPSADFIVTYHPDYSGLFVATGGSGHAFKFLPVLGERIADCVEGKCPEEFVEKWKWPTNKVDDVVTKDGSRGGRCGMNLDEEVKREARVVGKRF